MLPPVVEKKERHVLRVKPPKPAPGKKKSGLFTLRNVTFNIFQVYPVKTINSLHFLTPHPHRVCTSVAPSLAVETFYKGQSYQRASENYGTTIKLAGL